MTRIRSITIAQLIADTGARLVCGSADVLVTDLTDDSRTVGAGSLFVARRGLQHDGRKFAGLAAESGAVAVLSDDSLLRAGPDVAILHCEDLAQTTGRLAETFFDYPSKRLCLIGITGTNGKTTTAYLIRQLLSTSEAATALTRPTDDQHRPVRRCGMIGTVEIHDGHQSVPASLTTPFAIDLSRMLARLVDRGCTHCVLEVSSHALEQGRTAGLRFRVGVFTNLSGDHLDYHITMDSYAQAKARLFDNLEPDRLAVVNMDDPAGPRMLRDCPAANVIACHTVAGNVDNAGGDQRTCHAQILGCRPDRTRARMLGPWGELEIDLPLVGVHNVANALQTAAVAHWLGLTREQLHAGLSACQPPPGRLQPVTRDGDPFTVLVDYAHTDDALASVLRAVRPTVPDGGRLIVLFGCGGDRDRTKRPRMAEVASQLADLIYITSDNSRTEDPEAIVADILAGLSEKAEKRVSVDVDRESAIRTCIANARANDVIVVAGKGHEDYQIIGTERRPFADWVVARRAIDELRDNTAPATPSAFVNQ